MGDLCSNINTFIALHAILTTELENPDFQPSSPEAAAIKRLKDSGIPLVPLKRRKGGTSSGKKAKKDTAKDDTPPKKTEADLDKIADDRIQALLPDKLPPPLTPQELIKLVLHPTALATQEEEDAFVLQMMRGFAAPEGTWTSILTAAGLHSNQKVTIKTTTAAAAAEVPGQPVSLVTAESNLFSLIKTTRADTYAAERIMLCEAMCTQPAWRKLNNNDKGAHNRKLYMAQNPKLFDADKTDAQKHKMLTRGGEHWKPMSEFLRNDRELLTRGRNQVFLLGQVFGLAAIIHPATSIDSLGRRTPTLSRVSRRLHLALAKHPELRREIEARADANLNVIREFVRGIVVVENKDPVNISSVSSFYCLLYRYQLCTVTLLEICNLCIGNLCYQTFLSPTSMSSILHTLDKMEMLQASPKQPVTTQKLQSPERADLDSAQYTKWWRLETNHGVLQGIARTLVNTEKKEDPHRYMESFSKHALSL
ncbi:hypothetical protein B0H10DRAFT_2223919 [Mycena sp. CBHHK59/15]|nr:hypothetical protein B0H10DRAFT_2223919 [Mycena sp. CBHHK59/15]